MKNLFTSTLAAIAIFVPTIASANPADLSFNDQDLISGWSEAYVSMLVDLGILEGYPDGSFRPAANVTREEMAVALSKAMILLETEVYNSMLENDTVLYNELVKQQSQILQALVAIDELQAEAFAKSRNWLGLSISYDVSNESVDDNAYVTLQGRIGVIELTDSMLLSIRPFANTTGEAGASLTLDYELSSSLTVFAGPGIVGSWSDSSALTGDSSVAGFANAGLEYHVNNKTVIFLDGKVPFTGSNSGNAQVGAGIGIKF